MKSVKELTDQYVQAVETRNAITDITSLDYKAADQKVRNISGQILAAEQYEQRLKKIANNETVNKNGKDNY